jgi:hypothetical protein
VLRDTPVTSLATAFLSVLRCHFLDKEAPRYQTGYSVTPGFICLDLITADALEFTLKVKNKKKESLYG